VGDRLAAIGIEIDGVDGVAAAVTRLLPAARETVYRGGGSLFEWRDPSGAGMMVTTVTVDNVVRCVAPTFTAQSRIRAVPAGFGDNADCPFCEPLLVDIVDDDGRAAYPLAVHLEDAAVTRRHVPFGEPVSLAISAFAEQAKIWTSEAAYDREQAARLPVAFSSRTVVPLGARPDRHEPHAMVTGVVAATEVRTNESTGATFRWVLVDTEAGSLELVAAPDLVGDVAPGYVVQALCWLVARVTDGLSPYPLRRVRWRKALRRSP
jgi:hypothetical protein